MENTRIFQNKQNPKASFYYTTVLLNSSEKTCFSIQHILSKDQRSKFFLELVCFICGFLRVIYEHRICSVENKMLCAAYQSIFDLPMIWTINIFLLVIKRMSWLSSRKAIKQRGNMASFRKHQPRKQRTRDKVLPDYSFFFFPWLFLMIFSLLNAPEFFLPLVLSQRKRTAFFIAMNIFVFPLPNRRDIYSKFPRVRN